MAEALQYQFADPNLLAQAMAHRSYCAENPGQESNERLEFLGDAVLGWVVADAVYHGFPDHEEGRLSDLRKAVVNSDALAVVAARLGIGEHLLLGRGEARAGGREKRSILENAMEAVIGAVYLDGGPDEARQLITRVIVPGLAAIAHRVDELDPKTQLQELVAAFSDRVPSYVMTSSGPDHARQFEATVMIAGRDMGQGSGPTKKAAQRAAAKVAIGRLGELDVPAPPGPPADPDA